ncbi:hypothetical protein HU200_003498 [Digitaria exilis]|uniref:Pectinesterase n=1 Tax=Digitaria exilis TaxID=1010633 RepID=A0A835FYB4_9POAL|nr:hypothetical protein HU200_003498 [Digitaria exilis]
MTTLLLLACRGSHGHAASAADIEEELAPAWAVPHLRRLLARHKVDAVVDVSTRGGHHYGSIAEALAAAPPPPGRYTVHVRAGIYREPINITRSDVTLIGDGMGRTVISGNQSMHTGHGMLQSAILTVSGNGFMARDLTLQNTAGASAGPAVALMTMSDQSVYYRCRIMGTVDFIFGYAKAVFQECQVLVRRSVDGKDNVITAQGRDGPDNQSGFVFQRCAVKALPGDHLQKNTRTFLGRPWKKHSRVVFMRCALDSIVNPEGWLQWNATTPVPDTVYYAEYRNTGPGANTQGRVKWDQLHLLKEPAEAANFSVHNFIQGDDWLPRFGITYDQE